MGVYLGPLTIELNGSNSDSISGRILRTVESISITAPAGLDGTVTIQTPDGIGTSPTWTALQSPPGTDIVIAASKTIVITSVPMHGIRVSSDASEDPAKIFQVFGEEKTHQ